ncbi:MAG: hypothetical protein ACYCYA_14430 [Actinomycetes bacterium]
MSALRLLPELEDALRQIPGVRAASVVTNPEAEPTEVHILASPGKPAKQVVRDIQSMAMAQCNIDLDHRIVSVVQIGETEASDDEEADASSGPRPRIASIAVRTATQQTEASVSLAVGEDVFTGTSRGPAGASHRPRLVAMATVEAVGTLLGRPCEVESAAVVRIGGRQVAVCVLTLMVPRTGEQALTGAALVRGDEADALARAVLSALNRQLTG